VQALYERYLHRAADSSGLASFTNFLTAGGTAEQAAALIIGSPEYYESHGATPGGFLSALYQDALNRQADTVGKAIFTNALASGASHAQVAAAIFASTEYRQATVAGYYERFLGRAPDKSGLDTFALALAHGARDEDIVGAILGSDEFFDKL
jgi:hypothetical protein